MTNVDLIGIMLAELGKHQTFTRDFDKAMGTAAAWVVVLAFINYVRHGKNLDGTADASYNEVLSRLTHHVTASLKVLPRDLADEINRLVEAEVASSAGRLEGSSPAGGTK
jgi:hypothetical protein